MKNLSLEINCEFPTKNENKRMSPVNSGSFSNLNRESISGDYIENISELGRRFH